MADRRCDDGRRMVSVCDRPSVLYGLHQIFTKLAAERISDGLGALVVETSAVVTIAVYLAGPSRTIVVRADPEKLRQYQISPDNIVFAVGRASTVLPSGNVRTGDLIRIASTNATLGGTYERPTNPANQDDPFLSLQGRSVGRMGSQHCSPPAAAQQMDFYIRSPEVEQTNNPPRKVFTHFFAMEVTWK